jgi:hypothetical protein
LGLGRRLFRWLRSRQNLACCIEISPTNKDLAPSSESAASLSRHIRGPITALDSVDAKPRADDVGPRLRADDSETDSDFHNP